MSERNNRLGPRLIRAFDRRQRRKLGIFEFTDDPMCLFRLQLGDCPSSVTLSDGLVLTKGEPALLLHLWSDRVSALPEGGADLAWARKTQRMIDHSMQRMAAYIAESPELDHIPAVGNISALPFSRGTIRMLERVGYDVMPPHVPETLYERAAERVRQVWTWLLRKAFNPESARGRTPSSFSARPIWISRKKLFAMYGPEPDQNAESSTNK